MSEQKKQWGTKLEKALINGGVLSAIVAGIFLVVSVLISDDEQGKTTSPSNLPTSIPTATCCASPSPTATPEMISLELRAVAEKCRTGSFSDGSGSSYVAIALDEESCPGITLGWSVPNAGNYAGCIVDLPSDILPLSKYSHLVLRVEGLHGGEKFQIGLIKAGQSPITQHKEVKSALSARASQPIEISLVRFLDQNTALDSLNQLVFGVNYELGSRASSICITEISFVSK